MAAFAGRFTMMWLVWTMMLSLSSALHGCDSGPAPITGSTAQVIISGQKYTLEVAAETAVRMKGLGGRTSIAEDGGMIFAFPREQVRPMGFVMRDCPIDIDIIYLNGGGQVIAMYEMKHETPRAADGSEGVEGDSDSTIISDKARREGDQKYDDRLKKYESRFPCTFAIELKAGSIKKLGVKEGDRVVFDVDGLKRLAK